MRNFKLTVSGILVLFCVSSGGSLRGQTVKIPIVYSSDLFQPPDDPDDHFDWVILSGIKELDVKAFIFDLASPERKVEDVGVTALSQIGTISGKTLPPSAVGLRYSLKTINDNALGQPKEYQGGVELLLNTLRQSDMQVILFMVGSCRDFAAAFNREPELMRRKVKAIYVNAGNGRNGEQWEWNVRMEPTAYKSLMSSGLPIYWCPCVTGEFKPLTSDEIKEGKAYCTFYFVDNQSELLKPCKKEIKNYFAYALNKSTDDPIAYVHGAEQALPSDGRNMWCTGPFIHASGRRIYQLSDGKYIACTPGDAKQKGIISKEVEVFCYEDVDLKFDTEDSKNGLPMVRLNFDVSGSSMKVFRYVHPSYNRIMTAVLSEMLSEW